MRVASRSFQNLDTLEEELVGGFGVTESPDLAVGTVGRGSGTNDVLECRGDRHRPKISVADYFHGGKPVLHLCRMAGEKRPRSRPGQSGRRGPLALARGALQFYLEGQAPCRSPRRGVEALPMPERCLPVIWTSRWEATCDSAACMLPAEARQTHFLERECHSVSFRRLRTSRRKRPVGCVPTAAVSNRSKTVSLLDHLVGAGEQRRPYVEAERLRCG
jgi:hypothetical protein